MHKEGKNSEIAHAKGENNVQKVVKKEVKGNFFIREGGVRKAYLSKQPMIVFGIQRCMFSF